MTVRRVPELPESEPNRRDNPQMANGGRDKVLEIVDLVLGDLRLRDRLFTARRPDPERPEVIVIQTGEEGRQYLPAPNLGDSRTLEAFIAAAQAHVQEVYGQPVPLCPMHHHALVGKVDRGEIAWTCPNVMWSCRLAVTRRTPGRQHWVAATSPRALCARLGRRGVTGWRRIVCVERDGQWIAQVRIWPMSPAISRAINKAAAPIPVVIEASPGPLPPRVTSPSSTSAVSQPLPLPPSRRPRPPTSNCTRFYGLASVDAGENPSPGRTHGLDQMNRGFQPSTSINTARFESIHQ